MTAQLCGDETSGRHVHQPARHHVRARSTRRPACGPGELWHLATAARTGDLVCRFGGDEFVVLCEGMAGLEELDARADQLIEQFTEPFVADGLTFDIGISVGVAMAEPGDAEAPDGLILRADRAMYAAKAHSRLPSGDA